MYFDAKWKDSRGGTSETHCSNNISTTVHKELSKLFCENEIPPLSCGLLFCFTFGLLVFVFFLNRMFMKCF